MTFSTVYKDDQTLPSSIFHHVYTLNADLQTNGFAYIFPTVLSYSQKKKKTHTPQYARSETKGAENGVESEKGG